MRDKLFTVMFLLLALQVMGQQKPNIIVFMVDYMGWQDTSVPFGDQTTELNRRYYTPNMERLARDGMKFTNAYATPICTPTRTSMLTGMNAAHHAVTNWTSPRANNPTDNADSQFNAPKWNHNGLSPVAGIAHTVFATPYPQLLKDAGYFTIHVGKAHWGPAGTPGSNPFNLGFMVNIAGHSAGHPQSYLGQENYGNIPGKAGLQAVPDLQEYYGTETFLSEALTLEALKTLENPIRNNQPFYLSMAHYAVHVPIQADKRFVEKYLNDGLEVIEASYASLLEGMDKSLGDIMDYLKAKGVEKNTIIIFMSDNGGLSIPGSRGGAPHTQNLPLRAGKGSVYEGGIREPMLIKWPGFVKRGSVASEPVIIEDFFPTILEMAKIKKYKTVQKVDGKSFIAVLKNPLITDTTRSLIWHIPNKWTTPDGPGINYKSAIRQGDWKLIYNMRSGAAELYHLKNDIGEQSDMADKYPEKVRTLATLLSNQLREWKAPMPSFKQTGGTVPLVDERFR